MPTPRIPEGGGILVIGPVLGLFMWAGIFALFGCAPRAMVIKCDGPIGIGNQGPEPNTPLMVIHPGATLLNERCGPPCGWVIPDGAKE